MIISHNYKFIFLKTQKTAGTSLELALSEFCGPEDIITPLFRKDEQLRKERGYPCPRNHHLPFWKFEWHDWINLYLKGKPPKQFYNHIPAWKVKELVGNRVWQDYFKFCFERNPWDKVISLYYWNNRKKKTQTISEFINNQHFNSLKKKGYYIYTIDNEIAVDKIYKYEDMNWALEDIRNRLSLPKKLQLPKAKGGYRTDKRHYKEILTQQDSKTIQDYFNQEISLFNYKY